MPANAIYPLYFMKALGYRTRLYAAAPPDAMILRPFNFEDIEIRLVQPGVEPGNAGGSAPGTPAKGF